MRMASNETSAAVSVANLMQLDVAANGDVYYIARSGKLVLIRKNGQIVVTTHSNELSERLEKLTSHPALQLVRGDDGATRLQT